MNESELILGLKNKDNEAYVCLYKKHYTPLYYSALKILKNSHDANDAIQITFIKIFTQIESYEGRGSLSAWIYTITKNICNDILRLKNRSYVLFENINIPNDEIINPISLYLPGVEELYLKKERDRALYESIDKLTARQKNLIMLRYIHDLSYKQIEEKTGLKSGTVKSGINRAKSRLKKFILENKEFSN